MTKNVMSPSETPITAGQIGKIQELLGAGLRKSRFQQDPIQEIIEYQGDKLVADLVAVVRKYVDMVGDSIVRHVKVDRSRSPDEVLKATRRRGYYVDRDVVATMPGSGLGIEEADVHFFWVWHVIDDNDLEEEYRRRGLKPADPYLLAAVNEADLSFAYKHRNATHWKDADGKWCFIKFTEDQELVGGRTPYYSYVECWFAGIPRK